MFDMTHRTPSGKINYRYLFSGIFALALFFLLQRYIAAVYPYLISPLLQHFFPALWAFLVMMVVTPVAMFLARKFSILDKWPEPEDRAQPVPLLGGSAIFISFVLIMFLHYPWPPRTASILIGGGIIFVLGTVDDIRPLSSTVRLIGQVAASFIVMSSGLVVSFLPDMPGGFVLEILITLFWIIGIINAANFVDGVDGLAAGFAAIASVFFFLITLHLGQYHVSLLASVLIGCGAGFLVFNFKPAKIYLGDGGSTFLGFLLASFAVYGEWSGRGPVIALGIPALVLGVLIFDMIYITISRIQNGRVRNFREWLDYRGKDHFHHRLMLIGFKEEETVVFIYLISIILGLSALVLENVRVSYPVILLMMQAALIFFVVIMLMRVGRENVQERQRKL
jgi:UDP-GlcNAc:undecaprenyl-phosphate GlcNAc-1-phosphate transferase